MGEYDALGSAGGPRTTVEPRIRMAAPVVGPEEHRALSEVLDSGILTNGPWTRRFEAAMAERHGTEHAVALANGTVALSAMFLACGIGPGDEVIVPSLTFVSTATSVLHVGATPVFADVRADTYDLDPDDVARKVTHRTRAVVPVHYAGQPAELDVLTALADDAGVVLLEDAAQAHGAHFGGRPAGSWGRAGMFSFTPTKNITTGEGGVVTTDDGDLAQAIRLLRNHGMSALYRHELVGFNWRMTELQAALGVCQLARLDGILATKQEQAAHLDQLLVERGLEPPAQRPGRTHPRMIYTVQLPADRRAAAQAALTRAGIEHRIYFPPAHRQPVFASVVADLPVTEAVAERILSVPCHTRVTDADRVEIADLLAGAVAG